MWYGALGENAIGSETESAATYTLTGVSAWGALGAHALGQQGYATGAAAVESIMTSTVVSSATFAGASLATSTLTSTVTAAAAFVTVMIVQLANVSGAPLTFGAITSSQVVNYIRQIGVIRAITTGSLTAAVIKLLNFHVLALTQTLSAAVIREAGKIRAATIGSSVLVSRNAEKIVSATLAMIVAVQRGIGKIISPSLSQLIEFVGVQSGTLLATMGQSIAVRRSMEHITSIVQILVAIRHATYNIAYAFTQTLVAAARKEVYKQISAATGGFVVSLVRSSGNVVAATYTQIINRSHILGIVNHAVMSLGALVVRLVSPTALRHWPANVSSAFMMADYAEELEGNIDQFTPEVGMPKTRRRSSNSTERLSGSIIMTTTEYATFLDFFRDTIEDGTKSFNMLHPRTQANTKLQFVEAPSISDYGPDLWKVSVKMRRQETSIVRPEIPPSTTYTVEPSISALGSMAIGQQGTVRHV